MPNVVVHQGAVLGSVLSSTLTAWRGSLVIRAVPQPPKPLRLYDIEGCPYCRRVREVLTALHLWSFESSPYSRLVRERLCELEIPYTVHNLGKEHWKEAGPATRRVLPNPYVPREGGKRHAFWQKHRWVSLPYLEDPNTGVELFESADIIDYLEATYAA